MFARCVEQIYWANDLIIAWLREPGNADAKAVLLASHILTVQSIWIKRTLGQEYIPDAWRSHAVEAMPALNDANRKGFLELLALDATQEITYTMLDGKTVRVSRIDDILMHVLTHGFHHAGQMAANATARGLKFPGTAFIQFARS
ncbi:MAG: DinB family protein [Fibrobacteria bacterium]